MTLASVRIERDGPVPVAFLRGEIDMANVSEVSRELFSAAPNDAVGLIVDLSGVTYLDSRGLHLLFELAERLRVRDQLLHVVVPVVASAAGVVVVWKSYFAPFTSSGVVFWGLMVFIAILAVTILALIYLRVRGHEEWMAKAQLVFEQSGSGH